MDRGVRCNVLWGQAQWQEGLDQLMGQVCPGSVRRGEMCPVTGSSEGPFYFYSFRKKVVSVFLLMSSCFKRSFTQTNSFLLQLWSFPPAGKYSKWAFLSIFERGTHIAKPPSGFSSGLIKIGTLFLEVLTYVQLTNADSQLTLVAVFKGLLDYRACVKTMLCESRALFLKNSSGPIPGWGGIREK